MGRREPCSKISQCIGGESESKGQAAVLAESVESVKATADADVMQALAKLVDELKRAKIGGEAVAQMTVNISGGYVGVGIGQNISVGTMNVGAPPRDGKG
jgi:hypothetical protein